MKKYVVLDKEVGETPLACAEKWRATHPQYANVSLAYAGRLDPMASGKLLILIGDECKNQTNYHGLDKEYKFSVLFCIESDSLDVLGRLTTCLSKNTVVSATKTHSLPCCPSQTHPSQFDHSLSSPKKQLNQYNSQLENCVRHGLAPRSAQFESSVIVEVTKNFIGKIRLPYPKFSSKTIQGKPLHTWTLENRLDEIEIPTKESEVYSLTFDKMETIERSDLVKRALKKINSIPEVTDPKKAIGNDFRRVDVRKDWNEILENDLLPESYNIAYFTCTSSSGTYMRSLASEISKRLGTCGLAWHIHRTRIGKYEPKRSAWDPEY